MTLNEIKVKLLKMSSVEGNYELTPENVFQIGNAGNRAAIATILDSFLLPGSRIDNIQALVELFRRSKAGESCLVLAEHYSNFDFPMLFRLVERAEELGLECAERLLPMRGMKLSETNLRTANFTRSYDAIIIYPSRALDSITDPQELKEIRKISVPINHAAMREMIHHKNNGRVIVVFPSGTRYRHWKKDTRKGVREIYSYLKAFENVLLMGINGNTLLPNESENMEEDLPISDLMILTCSNIFKGRDFKRREEARTPDGIDSKQYVVDRIMEELFTIHDRVEPLRLKEKARFKQES